MTDSVWVGVVAPALLKNPQGQGVAGVATCEEGDVACRIPYKGEGEDLKGEKRSVM